MIVKCRFGTSVGVYDFGVDPYTCCVDGIKEFASNKQINSFTGKHKAGKGNHDVTWLEFKNMPIGFVPRNLHKVFPNVKYLTMLDCNLSQISKKDFKGLENIECLNLGKNKLKLLPDDLFADMKKIRKVYFNENQIERMSSKLLLPIKKTLECANLQHNTNINESFNIKSSDRNDLAKFMNSIDSRCLNRTTNFKPSTTAAGSHGDRLAHEVSKFKVSGDFTDFTIKVRGKEFKIHKVIFAAQSSVFKNIFTDDTEEVLKTFKKIKNFSDETFESFVDFFYTGKVADEVNAIEMFELASEFEVAELKVICAQRIIAKLDESNAVEVFNIAHRHQSEELKKKSFVFIKKIFPELDDNFEEKLDEVNGLVALKAQMDAIIGKK